MSATPIEVRVRHLDQLFNVIDPAPFLDKALDPEAAEFILDAAEAAHHHDPLTVTIHVATDPGAAGAHVAEAVRNHFAWRAERDAHAVRQLRSFGRRSLVVGLGFLAFCLLAARLVGTAWPGPWAEVLTTGLTIVGWVSLWRPLEILLYEWWPLRWRERLHRRLAAARIEVRVG